MRVRAKVRKTYPLALLAAVVLLLPSLPISGQATVIHQNDSVPFAQLALVPCANGGVGELVLLSGDLHVLTHITLDGAGGAHVVTHFQPQGATGVGLTTGDIYRATGVTRESFSFSAPGLPFTDTFVNNFKIIGPGPDNNLLVHQTVHQTVTATGNVNIVIVNNVTCQ